MRETKSKVHGTQKLKTNEKLMNLCVLCCCCCSAVDDDENKSAMSKRITLRKQMVCVKLHISPETKRMNFRCINISKKINAHRK